MKQSGGSPKQQPYNCQNQPIVGHGILALHRYAIPFSSSHSRATCSKAAARYRNHASSSPNRRTASLNRRNAPAPCTAESNSARHRHCSSSSAKSCIMRHSSMCTWSGNSNMRSSSSARLTFGRNSRIHSGASSQSSLSAILASSSLKVIISPVSGSRNDCSSSLCRSSASTTSRRDTTGIRHSSSARSYDRCYRQLSLFATEERGPERHALTECPRGTSQPQSIGPLKVLEQPLERLRPGAEASREWAVERENQVKRKSHNEGEAEQQYRPNHPRMCHKQPVEGEQHKRTGNEQAPQGTGSIASGTAQTVAPRVEPDSRQIQGFRIESQLACAFGFDCQDRPDQCIGGFKVNLLDRIVLARSARQQVPPVYHALDIRLRYFPGLSGSFA